MKKEVKQRLLSGVGVNDSETVVKMFKSFTTPEGIRKQQLVWICPYYQKWKSMLDRCYSPALQQRHPTYKGCSIYPEWVYFSNFKKWVDTQPNRNWRNCHLDKDILSCGNKVYSPEECVFISAQVNTFITDSASSRGMCAIGVSFIQKTGMYKAYCRNPFKSKQEYLGYFHNEMDAHLAWKKRKHKYACELADLQYDARVAEVLRSKYKPD